MIKFFGVIIINIFYLLINSNVLCMNNKEQLMISKELKDIYEADQRDREYLNDTTKILNSDLMDYNDSIRLSRVIELDTNHLINSDIDKYYAAFIYNHCGGSKMKGDSMYYLRAIKLCNEIISSSFEDYLCDTIPLKKLQDNEYYQMLKNINTKKLIIDTLINPINTDTLLIVKSSIKNTAKNFKELVEANYNKKFVKKEESVDLNKLDDPEYRKHIKEKIKEKIRIKNSSLNMTDEQIDFLAEQQIQQLIDYKKYLIEDIQKNPEKYKIEKK